MATMKLFGQLPIKFFNKELKWSASGGDTFKVALYTGTIPGTAQDAWVYKSDISTIAEVTGTNYTTGGKTLTNLTITYNSSTNVVTLDADDIVWSNSTITAALAIIYQDTGTASTSCLIGYCDFGGSLISSNGNFTITWDSNGLATFTVA